MKQLSSIAFSPDGSELAVSAGHRVCLLIPLSPSDRASSSKHIIRLVNTLYVLDASKADVAVCILDLTLCQLILIQQSRTATTLPFVDTCGRRQGQDSSLPSYSPVQSSVHVNPDFKAQKDGKSCQEVFCLDCYDGDHVSLMQVYIWRYDSSSKEPPVVILKTKRTLRGLHFHPTLPLLLTAEVSSLPPACALPLLFNPFKFCCCGP